MDEPLPMQIDHALEQTRLAGCTYAAVPLPWLWLWLDYAVDRKGSRFQWWRVCMHNGDQGDVTDPRIIDDNGNVILCMRPRDHDGRCTER